MMTLTGPEITSMAAALVAAYPDVDRLSVTPATLSAYLQALFGDQAPVLSDDEANAVRWQWMRLAEEAA